MGPFEKKARIAVLLAQFGFMADATIINWLLGWPIDWWLVPIGSLAGYNAVRLAGYAWGAGKFSMETAVGDTYARESAALSAIEQNAIDTEALDEAGQHAKALYEEARERALASAD